jgi:hypothetical protein
MNRLILDEGAGDSMPQALPKVEYSGKAEGEDDRDPFEDSLEDALCVFKSGGGKDSDILKENEA